VTDTDDITRHVRLLRRLILSKRRKYLATLERVLGKETADRVRQAYTEDWKARKGIKS